MKYINSAIIASLLLLAACKEDVKVDLAQAKAELIATDSSFSKMLVQQGMTTAFLYYADSNIIELNDGDYPTQGRAQMEERFKQVDDSRILLAWVPLKCEIASSGDLGYTFGNWQMQQKLDNGGDTVLYGNYISVWKKNSLGNWKLVLDGGNSAPGPSDLKR